VTTARHTLPRRPAQRAVPTKARHPVRRPPPHPVAFDPLAPGPGRAGHLAGGHYVHVFALTRAAKVTAQLAEAGARVTGGYGKWEEVAVPRGQSFTQWTGRTLLAMELELVLNGWQNHRSVEPEIKAIEEMGTPPAPRPPGGAPVTPPPVRIVGAAPHTELTWVVASIDWGDVIRDPATGARLRQAVTLHLMQYVEEAFIGAAGAKAPPRKVRVKHGDDLKKLAAHYLGKSSRWPEIVKLNKGLRGWRLAAKMVGKTILIPGH